MITRGNFLWWHITFLCVSKCQLCEGKDQLYVGQICVGKSQLCVGKVNLLIFILKIK